MSKTRLEIDGRVYAFFPVTTPGHFDVKVSKTSFRVFWMRDRFEDRVEIGRLKKWNMGRGWVVIPRIGGTVRAKEAGLGLASTKLLGVKRLVELARTEGDLTVAEKVRLRIIVDDGHGPVDHSENLIKII